MVTCEMCGKKEANQKAVVEGSLLEVCSNCAKFGHVIEVKNEWTERMPSRLEIRQPKRMEVEEEVILPDFAERIKNAREKLELTQKKVGEGIAEKESVIQKLESNHAAPSLELAKKLEHFLHINLVTTFKPNYEKKELNLKDSSLTIGDLVKIKRGSEKEKI